ncbi:MAG TPA: winged helix-turn-helix domain-containing protein, partial [Usitatibacter sp.]|nr:winged helix-turn-helix domain-containing protein [Usitatibacter sp.]
MAADLPKTSWKRETAFRMGDVEVVPASGEIRTRHGLERLRPLLMDIVLRLAAEPGAVVRRETLLEEVWRRRMVNDEVLSRAMAELRTVLGDDPRSPRYIETLPKLGYRLVAPVSELELPSSSSPPATPSRPRVRWMIPGVLLAAAAGIATWWGVQANAPSPADLERRLALARPFTSDPQAELSPRFSADGTRVAFALADSDGSRIAVQSVDGAARRLVGAPSETRMSPVFFPDANRLAYWKASASDCAIVEHDLATGIERVLLDCAMSPRARFDLSADGRWIAFSGRARRQDPDTLWLLEIGNGTPQPLTTRPQGLGDDVVPRFSPDGTRIAFFRGNETHRAPWIVERGQPASARQVGRVEGLSYGLAWMGRDGPLLVAAD